jgi:hypothetical protein
MPKSKKEILKNLSSLSKLKVERQKTPPSELRQQLVGEVYILAGDLKREPYITDDVIEIKGKYNMYRKVVLRKFKGPVNKGFVVLKGLECAVSRLREPTQAEVALFNAKRPERLLEALEWI